MNAKSNSEEDLWQLPTSWLWKTMGDISLVMGGGTPSTTMTSNFGNDIPWITPADMSQHNDIYIAKGARSLSVQGYETSGARKMPKGTVLFSSRAPIGYVAIAANELTTNQGFKSFVPYDGLDPKYMYYWLISAKNFAEKLASGTTFLEISGQKAALIPFPLSPQNEQKRIVEKIEELFSDLDNGIAELKAAQIKLTHYRQSLLKSAVEGILTENWRKIHVDKITETGEQLLARILKQRRENWEEKQLAEFQAKDKKPPKNWQEKYPEPVTPDTSGLPELPEGWVWASLDMLANIVSGITKGTKRKNIVETREIPYLRVANVQRGYIDLTEVKTIEAIEDDIKKYTLEYGDILFNEGGDIDKLGRGWVWYEEVEKCIHQNHVFRARLFVKEVVSEFISHHGNTFGKDWFQGAGKQTTNLASINKGILQKFPVPLPPISEQKEIMSLLVAELIKNQTQQEATEKTLLLLNNQRKNILKEAFSGKLVPQNDNDEPTSELLKKIQQERSIQQAKPKEKRKTTTKKKVTIMDTLLDVLESESNWLDAQEAFRRCGIANGTNTDKIEEIYAELRRLDKQNRLEIQRVGNFDQLRLKQG
ncbi:restriction endonuclease subunit S [Photorhabdus khanii]|uniref:Restriction endonuclease subunit S n=1 Tax=Photorhabdus khanii subsp. guanajuatensis TaxID=2100166 RepID=A0A4R4J4D1_9GAMM|nr:restriction endonuclease subunit S [Photorhabdus khanii]TDB48388.1 restriction endonuclease subunit S [Photorhabdus khanii subsp. guanajuatensis]